jgi:hypothetical protein
MSVGFIENADSRMLYRPQMLDDQRVSDRAGRCPDGLRLDGSLGHDVYVAYRNSAIVMEVRSVHLAQKVSDARGKVSVEQALVAGGYEIHFLVDTWPVRPRACQMGWASRCVSRRHLA